MPLLCSHVMRLRRESRQVGKLPTHDRGETRHSDMTSTQVTNIQASFRPGVTCQQIQEEVFVSKKTISAILLAFALFTAPAFAQPAAQTTNSAPPSAAATPDALTPEQARRAV